MGIAPFIRIAARLGGRDISDSPPRLRTGSPLSDVPPKGEHLLSHGRTRVCVSTVRGVIEPDIKNQYQAGRKDLVRLR